MTTAVSSIGQTYLREGYVQVTYPELRGHIDEFMRRVYAIEAMGRPQSWTYRTINNSLAFQQFIFGLAPSIYETARDLVGSRNLATISPAFRMDAPGDDAHLRRWHQDSNYFLETESGDSALVLWIPLVPATLDNGSIAICPGSHLRGRLGSSYVAPDGDASEQYVLPESEVPTVAERIEAAPGDVVFVHMDAIHSSMTNRSRKTRYTAQLRLAALDDPSYEPVKLRPHYEVRR